MRGKKMIHVSMKGQERWIKELHDGPKPSFHPQPLVKVVTYLPDLR